MELSVKALIAQQAALFDSITRTFTSLELPKEYTARKLQNRLDYIQAQWNQCMANHQQIMASATAADFEGDYLKANQYGTQELLVLDYSEQLQDLIDAMAPPVSSSPIQGSSIPGFANLSNSFKIANLPKIGLPTFSGAYADWASFHDYFTSLVLNNPHYDELLRLHYLKSCVDGEAAALLKNIKNRKENF